MTHPRHPGLVFAGLVLVVLALGALPARAAPATYEIDLSHSSFLFRVKHLDIGYTHGRFNEFSGRFVVDEQDPAASSVQVTVKTTSVDTNDEKRDQHLRSPDFFNVNQFPTMAFQSKSVKRTAATTWEVSGDLTLHGVTKPLVITMEKTGEGQDPWGNHRAGFEGTAKIERSAFGMDKLREAVGDTIDITIAVEGIRK